jgi:hypothetical protein
MRYFVVERLRAASWLFSVWPRIRRSAGGEPAVVWYVDGDRGAVRIASAMLARTATRLERLEFSALEIFEEDGSLLWQRLQYDRILAGQRHLLRQAELQRFRGRDDVSRALRTFVLKRILPGTTGAAGPGLWRALYLVHVALWRARSDGVAPERVELFLRRWPWMSGVRDYAREHGIGALHAVGRESFVRDALRQVAGRELLYVAGALRRLLSGRATGGARTAPGDSPRIGLQYYGHFNLEQPERYSDFFFWQRSTLPGERLLAFFGIPQDPLDGARREALARHGIGAIATRHAAAADETVPVDMAPSFRAALRGSARVLLVAARPLERGWLDAQRAVFDAQKEYWKRLFARHRVKVFTTWFKYNADHCPLAEALRELGGVLAVYQRSYEGEPTAKTALVADVYFGFSREVIGLQASVGSHVDCFVVTGYLGDHRFALARGPARAVREALLRRGARRILAYFDEGSHRDRRWGLEAARLQEHYAYLLEALLRESDLGLVLKPKVPRSLRERLGPAAALLERAIATGRCHLYDEGVMQGAVIPAQAALSADLAVHGSLVSGTAAAEAALAGVPTALIDDDGWRSSPLLRLGVGKVVFRDWPSLLGAWREHRRDPAALPGFADWTPILPEIDPFRDGRGAERMGNFLRWLIEAFAAGRSRDQALAEAAERYRAAWGEQAIAQVRPTTAP